MFRIIGTHEKKGSYKQKFKKKPIFRILVSEVMNTYLIIIIEI